MTRKLTYWYARCLNDSDAYSIRARTRREAAARVTGRETDFGPVVKVVVEYRDGFDLVSRALGEGRLAEEASAAYAAEQNVRDETVAPRHP